MAGADQLGKIFQTKFRKDRRLLQTDRKQDIPRAADVFDRAKNLTTSARKVLGKVQLLLEESSKLAARRTVPVIEDAREVRAAVRRKREGSAGEFIELRLYLEALDYLQREKEAVDEDVLAILPGDAATAAAVLETTKTMRTESMNKSDAVYMASQAFTLIMLKLLNKGTDNIDTQAQTASKQPSGSEVASVAIAIAISIITRLLVTNLLEDEISDDFVDQPGFENVSQTDIDASKAAALALLENMRAYKLAKLYKNPGDYRLIIDYVQNYLAETREPGWEEWQLIPDIKATGGDIEAIVEVMDVKAPEYDEPKEANGSFDTSSLIGPDSPIGNIFSHSSFEGGQKSDLSSRAMPGQPNIKALEVYEAQIANANGLINKAAAVLSWKETQDTICCLIRIAGGMDVPTIRSIRTVLNASIDGLSVDLNYVATGYMNQSWTLGKRASTRLLWELMEGYDKFVDKLWSYVADDETAQLVAACTPVDEILTFISDWARGYLDKVVQFVLKYADALTVMDKTFLAHLGSVGSLKKIRRYIAILDMVMAAADKAELCSADDTSTPTVEEVTRVSNTVLGALPDTLVLTTTETDDPYTTFAMETPYVLENGVTFTDANEATAVADGRVKKIDQEECRKRLTGSDLKQFDAFVREINERSSELPTKDIFPLS
jgi:hypothetical protein